MPHLSGPANASSIGLSARGEAAIDEIARPGASVQLLQIAKHYGRHRAIDGLNLDIRAGEFITLLGPSGSGKTTTLMLIAGFEAPTAGEILIGGTPVVRLPAYQRNIGMVFQSYALFPHLTVAENIGFPLKQRGVGRAARDAAVNRMLDLVQLPGFAPRYPQQLSGGQQQRVAIARAIVFNPRVLLMDEPLSALDKQLRESLQLEIKRLHDRLGMTFVYVTHDQREALVMSDRVSVMNEGRIEQLAIPQALYDVPENRFVASFIGEANFAAVADISEEGQGLSVATAWGVTVTAPHQVHRPGCACMVRPERMTAMPLGPVPPGHNGVVASVTDIVFMGEATRYALQTATGETLLVKQTNRAGVPFLPIGTQALVTWAVADTRLVS